MGIQDTRPLMGDKIAGAARDETAALISSAKVEGTPVCRSDGDKVGHIDSVMIDKRSGKVAYAVLRFGGFLGIGDEYYPLPWSLLTYNERLGGYEVNITDDQLKGAPHYKDEYDWNWSSYDQGRTVYNYYGLVPYWL